jgi:hypothetical protein
MLTIPKELSSSAQQTDADIHGSEFFKLAFELPQLLNKALRMAK